MEVIGVPGDKLRTLPVILKYFDEFTDDGAVNSSDMVEQVESRDRQCWTVIDGLGQIKAVALTRIMTGNYLTCEITHLTGHDLREWHDAYLEIEKWARYMGCKRILATARPGYAKIGRKYGLKLAHVILEKELTNGNVSE